MFLLKTWVLAFGLLLASVMSAQTVQPGAKSQASADMQKFVAAQFGSAYTLVPGFTTLAGDLDDDGAEDAVFVATAKNPLLDEVEFHYKTIDPYNSFFGFGDPRVTLQFAAQEGEPRFLLIVHGWRLAVPKAKFVVINLPFQKIRLDRVALKKKTIAAIALEDRTEQKSDIFWTGKQWKWVDTSLGPN